MNQTWSYILGLVGLVGFVLAGKRVWWSWYINLFCQVLWFTYAILTSQFGFVLTAVVYTVVFGRNAVKWTKEHRKKENSDGEKEEAKADTAE